ncbi:MAG TPA: hypothetical protein VMU51_01675 [Mycobacteriales bacterium]|nr:hypothetical protein [Mycobacteriales bacterium]
MDQSMLRRLTELTDDAGILSIYATVDLAAEQTPQPAVLLYAQLAELQRRTEAEQPSRAAAVRHRLRALEPQLSALVNSSTGGIGRVLFAPVGHGQPQLLTFPLPVPPMAVYRRTAYLLPLLPVAEASAPVGVALLSRQGVRLAEWTPAGLAPLVTFPFQPLPTHRQATAAVRAGRGTSGWHAVINPEQAERHRLALLVRFMRQVSHGVGRRAASRGWNLLVVTGDPRLAEPFEVGLHDQAPKLLLARSPHLLSTAPSGRVVAEAVPNLVAFRRMTQLELARRARAAGLAGGHGAYGLGDCLGALTDGRVARLVVDGAACWRGSRTPDGRLVPGDEVPPGVPADALIAEPNLAESMVERALAIGADVTVVSGAAAEALAPAGVAAILRW